MAATTLLAASSLPIDSGYAGDDLSDLGGLKEWTTDMDVSDQPKLDEAAQKAADEAKKSDICIPVGEGENCW